MLKYILQIVACYTVGLLTGTFLFMPYTGVPLAIAFLFGGAFLALPALFLAILVFILFKKSVLRNLLSWCVAAPFLVVLTWLAIDWQFFYSSRGQDIYWFLSLKNVWETATLAFTCASISAFFFWYLNRSETNPESGAAQANG